MANMASLIRPQQGNLLVSLHVLKLNLRGDITYDLYPDEKINSGTLTSDYRLFDKLSLTASLNHQFQGEESTSYSLGLNKTYENKKYTLGFNTACTDSGDYSAGLSVFMSLGYDPEQNKAMLTSQSLANSGTVSARVFLDENQNGQFDKGDTPLPEAKVGIGNTTQNESTNDQGIAWVTGISPYLPVGITVDSSSLEDPYWILAEKGVGVITRPGVPVRLDFPVLETGEVEGTVYLMQVSKGNGKQNVKDNEKQNELINEKQNEKDNEKQDKLINEKQNEKDNDEQNGKNNGRRKVKINEEQNGKNNEEQNGKNNGRRKVKINEKDSEKQNELINEKDSEKDNDKQNKQFSEKDSEKQNKQFSEKDSEKQSEQISEKDSEKQNEQISEKDSEKQSEQINEKVNKENYEKKEASNVELELVDPKGKVIKKTKTAFDGYYLFDMVPLGNYTVRIAEEQIKRLYLLPVNPQDVTLTKENDTISGVEFVLEHEEEKDRQSL